jgi:peptidoglycan hydrolase-like protein with peptidoglycan-binding domain
MVLKRRDKGDAVKQLQRGLNKLGAMLLVDGDFGAGTSTAIAAARTALRMPGSEDEADDALQAAVAAVADPFPPLTAAGVTFMARLEVSDSPTYRKKFQTPCWPSAGSGITIGIGYDCRFVDATQLRRDWGAELEAAALEQLCGVVKVVGSQARQAQVSTVIVPLESAMRVFITKTLPEFLDDVRRPFPDVDRLPAARKTALVSLVYNRGASLTDKDPVKHERRREMRNIAALLAAHKDDDVAAEFESMTRLWPPGSPTPGLAERRRVEAKLWRDGFSAVNLE